MSELLRYCGRDFTTEDIKVIVRLTQTLPTRKEISVTLCNELGWLRLDGRTKDMSARVALLRMERDGLIVLPAPKHGSTNGKSPRFLTPELQFDLAMPTSLDELGTIDVVPVKTKAQSMRWRTLVASYHYLGYVPFAGAQLRYLVEASVGGTLGVLGFAASAWKCAPRDTHIGWDHPTREARLHLIVGNARFLILPYVHVPNLASFILGSVTRRIQADWQDTYNYKPVLLETFVETERFMGTCYKAANWQHVGVTKGRGKLDRNNDHALPVKDIYLYPLQRNYRSILTSPD